MNEPTPLWYYLNALNQVAGPASEAELQQLRTAFDFYVWKTGMADWTLASQVFGEVEAAGEAADLPKPKRLGRTAKELIGVCRDIIADGAVTADGAESLRGWIQEHPDVWSEWPAAVLCERISQVFAEGAMDENARRELLRILQTMCGAPEGEGSLRKCDTSLFDFPPAPVRFEECSFAFAGSFVHGSLARCKEEVRIRGGIYRGSAYDSQLSYVVVGALGLEDEKLAELKEWRRHGRTTAIIPESHWHEALHRYNESLIRPAAEAAEAAEVEPLDPKDYRLPHTAGILGNVFPVDSFTGSGKYTINLKEQTCTCPGFLQQRAQFPIGDVRRACRHLCKGMISKRLVMQPFLETVIRNRVEIARGFPIGEWFAWCRLGGHKTFMAANEGGWVNLFAPSHLLSGVGPYSDFAYSLPEKRWAYGNRPYRAEQLESFMHERTACSAVS